MYHLILNYGLKSHKEDIEEFVSGENNLQKSYTNCLGFPQKRSSNSELDQLIRPTLDKKLPISCKVHNS